MLISQLQVECFMCESFVMWHQLATKLVQFMAPRKPVRPPDVSLLESCRQSFFNNRVSSKQPPPVIETFDDEKITEDKDHKRDRDVSFSMAALPIPLGPLGGLTSLTG